jgi:hypothetical protein
MKKQLLLLAVAALAAAAAVNAQVVEVNGVGSSAQFQTASLAAFNLAGGLSGAGHWTQKNGGQIVDNRAVQAPPIVNQTGNLSVVWNNALTQVWIYLSVDSVVGNRAYFSQPRATLSVVGGCPAPAGTNSIAAGLWGADAALPAAVCTAINGAVFTAAFTDILPADAEFAELRVNCGTGTTATLSCLGYGTANPNVGVEIVSQNAPATQAQPVAFNILGNDPISGNAIPAYTVVPIGVAPIVFLANRTNGNGLGNGNYTDVTYDTTALLLFAGIDCDSSAFGRTVDFDNEFAINPILREPMSGTMNTFEFNIMVTNAQGIVTDLLFSQEGLLNSPYNIPYYFGAIQPGAANSNPLNLTCGGGPYASGPQGARKRAVGTGDEVSSVKANGDSIGYIFFGYGNVSSIAGSPNYGYLTYQSVDPINPQAGAGPTGYGPAIAGNPNWNGGGQLPTCTAPCRVTEGTSFPNVRNGSYQAVSVLRAVADTGSVSLTNVQALAANIADEINATQPDFLPYSANSFGDPGWSIYRSHFAPAVAPAAVTAYPGPPITVNFNATNTPYNGLSSYGELPAGLAEAGGDVGGCLQYKVVPSLLNCRH